MKCKISQPILFGDSHRHWWSTCMRGHRRDLRRGVLNNQKSRIFNTVRFAWPEQADLEQFKNTYWIFHRTPAPDSGVPMNSIPTSSKTFLTVSIVLILPAGISLPADSNRTIVEKAIWERSAKSLTVISVKALAALIWLLVIKINLP